MSLPDYNLNDHIAWATTRRIPLCEYAVSKLIMLVTNTYTTFSEEFAGISKDNTLEYLPQLNNISNIEDFYNDAQVVIIPHNLLNVIEFDYLLNNTLLNNYYITLLITAVKMTYQFLGFLTQLNGIDDTNNQDYEYRSVIELLMQCPKFLRDAETFSVTT